jgi:hypothetical protein
VGFEEEEEEASKVLGGPEDLNDCGTLFTAQ